MIRVENCLDVYPTVNVLFSLLTVYNKLPCQICFDWLNAKVGLMTDDYHKLRITYTYVLVRALLDMI